MQVVVVVVAAAAAAAVVVVVVVVCLSFPLVCRCVVQYVCFLHVRVCLLCGCACPSERLL